MQKQLLKNRSLHPHLCTLRVCDSENNHRIRLIFCMASLNILKLYAEYQNSQGQIGGTDYFLMK